MGHAVLDVLEAAYRLDRSDDEWVLAIARAIAPIVDDGTGVQAFTVDFEARGNVLGSECLVGGEPAWHEAWRANWWDPFMRAIAPETFLSLAAFSPVSYASHVWRATSEDIPTFNELLRHLAKSGYAHVLGDYAEPTPASERSGDERLFYPDSFNVVGLDPSGVGVTVVANRRERARSLPSDAVMHEFARVAAHLATAARLRRRLGAAPALEGAEAILDTDGRVAHAEGPAASRAGRETLRRAAVDMDRARSTRRAERERVLELWRTLHERRWTLVDVFDTDGRRFLVARENAPATPPHAKLTQRERQVTALLGLGLSNKAIAYELGLSPSTVATLVGRARAKLDLESVPELVRWARATYTRTESVDQIPDKNRASSRRE